VDGSQTPNWQRVIMALVLRMGDSGKIELKIKPQAKNSQPVLRQIRLDHWKINQAKPDIMGSLGFTPYQPSIPPIIKAIKKDSPAERGGLKPQDRILSVNGKPFSDWIKLVQYIRDKPGQEVKLLIERKGKRMTRTVRLGEQEVNGATVALMGVFSQRPNWPKEYLSHAQYSIFTAWFPATLHTYQILTFNARVLYRMILGKISLRALGGPVTIFQSAGQASEGGWQVYLGFIAFVSTTLCFINILPIPGLDGGHLMFYVIEAVFRKPVPEKYQVFSLKIGLSLLVGLMIYATMNDLIRLLI